MATKLKILFIGSSGVGKTSIIKRIHENTFYESYKPTRDAGFVHYKIEDYMNKNWHFLMWDVGSQLKFDKDLKRYFEGANVIVYVYDLTNPVSITEGYTWFVNFFSQGRKGIPILFVGNKSDLPLVKITDEDVLKFEKLIQSLLDEPIPTMYLRVSAKKNQGMQEIIQAIMLLAKTT